MINTALQKLILVIDDSPEILILDRILLEAEGHKVLSCTSADEAFAILKDNTPHLIILDYQLGDMKGDEFILLFEQQRPDIFSLCPIIFHSGMDHLPPTKARGHIPKFSDTRFFVQEIERYLQMRIY